jgi:hypothetical protein
MNDVCLVSAGMFSPKKGNERFRRAHRYLNYGLLGLASLLNDEWPVYHGNFDDPESFLAENPEIRRCGAILLSVPSYYALEWSQRFLRLVRSENPNCQIHVGGRWVIDSQLDHVRPFFPIDTLFYKGLGEKDFLALASHFGASVTAVDLDETGRRPLNYSQLKYRDQFRPSIEVSRGCGLGCIFCEEADVPLSRLKKPELIVDEMMAAEEAYGSNQNFYLEASMFAPSASWVNSFQQATNAVGRVFHWRTETRVDVLDPDKIESLARSGLCFLDLGLESGSAEQLKKMGKTQRPESYLQKAASVLRACHQFGVKAKVNILLYPGETNSTVSETMQFLETHREYIFGVSAYPVLAYGFGQKLNSISQEFKSSGAIGLKSSGVPGVWMLTYRLR